MTNTKKTRKYQRDKYRTEKLGFRKNGQPVSPASGKIALKRARKDAKQGSCLVCQQQRCICDEKSEWLKKRGL